MTYDFAECSVEALRTPDDPGVQYNVCHRPTGRTTVVLERELAQLLRLYPSELRELTRNRPDRVLDYAAAAACIRWHEEDERAAQPPVGEYAEQLAHLLGIPREEITGASAPA